MRISAEGAPGLASSPEIVTTRLQSSLEPRQIILILVGVNLVWRLMWLPMSQGAYTDGILQIDMFRSGLTYWPPLYALLVRTIAWAPGLGLERAGQFISVLAGTLTVIPVAVIAQRLFGMRAALFAMLAYTCSPTALRWSVQVMTDAPFMAFWMFSLCAMVLAAEAYWPELFVQPGEEKRARDMKLGGQWLLLASLTGALASLTRYQGIFLLPPAALLAWRTSLPHVAGRDESGEPAGKGNGAAAKQEPAPAGPAGMAWWMTVAPWGLVPLWILRRGPGPLLIHFAQIGDRAEAGSLLQTFLNYWYYFEQFVLMSPYFLTYGIFGFCVYGLFRTQYKTTRIRMSAYTAIYLTLTILVLHSVFQAFQSRYLLPLVPLACIGAGHGMAVWQKRCMENRGRFLMLAAPALIFGLLFSSLVAFYQGTPFIDIKEACQYVKTLPAGGEVFTTEFYNADVPTPKVQYWTGRDRVFLLGSEVQPKPGDYIIMPSLYGGLGVAGWKQYQQVKKEIEMLMPAKKLQSFAYISYPLLPDIMEEPVTHVNPLAWYLRYMRQNFETTVFQVVAPGTPPEPQPAAAAEEETPAPAGGGPDGGAAVNP